MNRRLYLIILFIVTIVICGAAANWHWNNFKVGCGPEFSVGHGISVTPSGNNIDKNFSVDKFDSIDISAGVADIKIEQGTEYGVNYYGDELLEPEVSVKGQKLSIRQNKSVKNANGHVNCKLTITLPDKKYDKVAIEAGVGNVTISDANFSDLTIKAGVGEAYLKNVTCTGETNIDAGVGQISLNDCTLDKTVLEAGVGDIQAEYTTFGKTRIDAGVGSIAVRNLPNPDDYDFILSSDLGDVRYNSTTYKKEGRINNIHSKFEMKIKADLGDVVVSTK